MSDHVMSDHVTSDHLVGDGAPSDDRSRTVTWADPEELARGGAGMAGIEFLSAMARGDLPAPPLARLLDFRVIEVGEGTAVFEATPAEFHYNPIGTVHGGLAATLFDSALGCAIHSTLPAGTAYTTLELKVNFLRPMTAKTGPVRCEATAIHVGRRVATAEARLVDADGRLYGHATTTCMILSGEGPAQPTAAPAAEPASEPGVQP